MIYRYKKIVESIAQVSMRIGELGYVASQGGNISCIADDGMVLLTPKKHNKRLITKHDICIMDKKGSPVYSKKDREATSEYPMHLTIYKAREDVKAIIHAHPPVTTGFAISRCRELEKALLPEACMELGPVLSTPYVDPGSDELAKVVSEALCKTNTVIMENHGVIVVSDESVERALELLELLEATAYSVFVAKMLGETHPISGEDLNKLVGLYEKRGIGLPGKPGYHKDINSIFK